MKTKDFLICTIYNALVLVCFTVLAVVFKHWWIVLFSTLCFSFIKTVQKHARVCDCCGKHSEPSDTIEGAINKAKLAGWTHNEYSDKDFCPECRKELFDSLGDN